MTSCDSFAEDLLLLLEGGLPKERRAALDEHLSSCPDCRAALADLRLADERLKGRGPEALPTELRRAVRRRLRRPIVLRPAVLVLAAAAACILLAVGLIALLSRNGQMPAPQGPKAVEIPAEAAQALSGENLARLDWKVTALSRERVARAIPSSGLSLLDAGGNLDDQDDVLSAPPAARIDRDLRSLAKRIETLGRQTWYLPPAGSQGAPSSASPIGHSKPYVT